MSRRTPDPARRAGRKKLLPALVSSALAVLIVCYAVGKFPQVDVFFANCNEIVHEHNDEIVRLILRSAPAAALLTGIAGLSYIVVSSIRSRRKAA